MSQEKRFTAWLSDDERERIEGEAKRLGTTMNFVVRVAVRRYFKLDTSRTTKSAVTGVTRNK